MKLLAINGSPSRTSLNRRLLQAAAEVLPEDVEFEIFDLHELPMYQPELDAPDTRPAPAAALNAAIEAADAVLIATPEYNYGVPGVLKNAIDWASRPAYASVFARKPVAIVSASPSALGGARAQGQLKQNLLGIIADIYPAPEFAMGGARGKFDAEGRLADEQTRDLLTGFLGGFVEFVDARRK